MSFEDGIDEETVTITVEHLVTLDGKHSAIALKVHDKDGFVGGASASTFAKAVDALARTFGTEVSDAQ